ncbi:MAG: group 1 glycosyl transferase [Gemmatimonadetes bacterium]|nr:group 1 glycosyl transferase [Gemmatimonadota bacterium]
MRILFLVHYGPLAASSRTRVFQYLPLLERAGFRTLVRVAIPDHATVRFGSGGAAGRLLYYLISFVRTVRVGLSCVLRAPFFDRIVIQKVLLPGPLAFLLRFWRSKIVYDFDDAIFTADSAESLLERLSERRREIGLPRMLRSSSVAIVENDYTRSYASDYCDRVEIITGPIDTDRFAPRERAPRSGIILGWIGSPTTTVYLEGLSGVLDTLSEQRDDLTLRLIGATPFDSRMQVEQYGWSLETEVDLLANFDIGLMPLPDDPWTRGKGGYKLLQYGAVGLPVVASPIGVNREIVVDGVTGFLAESDTEWVDALARLIDDPDLRQTMGQAGRDRMVEHYSLTRSSQALIEILS